MALSFDFENNIIGLSTSDVDGNLGITTFFSLVDYSAIPSIQFSGYILDSTGNVGLGNSVLATTGSGVIWVKGADPDAIANVIIHDEGSYVGQAKILDFVGSNILASVAGTASTITFSDSPIFTGLTVNGNTYINGNLDVRDNITIGGTSVQLNAQQLVIEDPDIVVGLGTTFSPTDFTASHGGIAIASTEGYPLVNLNFAGETLPNTYKKIMWFKGSDIGVGITDAWLFNYAVGVGSTQVPNGVRLAAGGMQVTDTSISSPNINISNTATIDKLDVNQLSPDGVEFGSVTYVPIADGVGGWGWGPVSSAGAATTTAININDEGVYKGYATTLNFVGSAITAAVSGGTATITLDSPSVYWLETSVGIHTLSNVGIGTTNPTSKLQVIGDVNVSGVVTATSFSGSGTNLTGIVTSIVAGTGITVSSSTGQVTINSTSSGVAISTNTTNQDQRIPYTVSYGSTTGLGVTDNLTYNPSTKTLKLYGNSLIEFDINDIRIGNTNTGSNNFYGENVFIGKDCGSNSNGTYNTSVGDGSFSSGSGAPSGNTSLGYISLYQNISGNGNVSIGALSSPSNIIGDYNTSLGYESSFLNYDGSYNLYLGSFNGISENASYKVIIGSGKYNEGLFDSPDTTKSYQFAVGIRTSTAPSKYWLVGNENFNVGIGTTNPTSKLSVQGDVNISGATTSGSFTGEGSNIRSLSGTHLVSYASHSETSNSALSIAGINTYSQVGILTGSLANATGDFFGWSVATSADGNTIVVGAFADELSGTTGNGLVYVFDRVGNTFNQVGILTGSLASATGDNFGNSVATSADGKTIVIGASNDGQNVSNSGLVYIFDRVGVGSTSTFNQVGILDGSSIQAYDQFGYSVEISADGKTIVVGANQDVNAGTGLVYVFDRVGNSFNQVGILTGTYAVDASDNFGFSVATSANGKTIVVGAPYDETGATIDTGVVYIFDRVGDIFNQVGILTGSLASQSSDSFGYSVATSADGNTIVVGSILDELSGTAGYGLVYIFDRVGNSFNQVGILTGSLASQTNDTFGYSVATSADGNTIVVGATNDEIGATTSTGVVYVFNRQGNNFNQVGIITGTYANNANDFFGRFLTISADGKSIIVGVPNDEIGATTSTGIAYVYDQVRDTYVYSGPTGNIGIGTTNPTSKLQVIGDVNVSGVVTATSFSGSGTNLTGIVTSIVAGTNITVSGSTGEVTINSTGGGGSISIVDDISTNDTFYVGIASTTTGNLANLNVSSSKLTFNPSTGNMIVGGTVTANSDKKLKTNIKTIPNALEKVLNLRGVEYDRIDTLDHQIGLIAQEVEEIVPEAVYPKSPVPDYETKSVAYANLVALLIEAVKEQNIRIEELERRLGEV